MTVVLTYDDNKTLLSADYYYGGEGWNHAPAKHHENQNNHISIEFKDGTASYSILWSYWKTMFFDIVMAGDICYDGWDIHEMFERLKTLAESVSEERKNEESDDLWIDNIYEDRVETLPQAKKRNSLEFISPEAEEVFLKMLAGDSSF